MAQQLGRVLVDRNYELVYGGAEVGLMGKVADTVMNAGGIAIGVISTVAVMMRQDRSCFRDPGRDFSLFLNSVRNLWENPTPFSSCGKPSYVLTGGKDPWERR